MRNLLLPILMMCLGFTALADSPQLGADPGDAVFYFHFTRSHLGSAINPETHTFCVPQDGLFEIAETQDTSVFYIKNIIYGAEMEFGDYWVQGYRGEDGSYRVPLGQSILSQDKNGKFVKSRSNAVLAWGDFTYNASTQTTTYVNNNSYDEIVYSFSSDGKSILIENTTGPLSIDSQDDVSFDASGPCIIWEETGEWAGYAEWSSILETLPPIITEQPEGELRTYNRTSNCIYHIDNFGSIANLSISNEVLSDEGQIVFVPDSRIVYLKDPMLSMSYGTWVIGSMNYEGTIITVPMNQCISPDQMAYLQMGGNYILDNIMYFSYLSSVAEYYIDGNTISLLNTMSDFDAPEPYCYIANGIYTTAYGNNARITSLEANIVYTLKSVEPTEKTNVPVFNCCNDEATHTYYVEILPSEPSTIYYRILYPNGEYSAWAEYNNVLTFSTSGDYRIEAYAQAVDKLPSDQIDYEFTISPVSGINELSGNKQIANVQYYNVMGQEISQPNGVAIIVTTFTDGTVTTAKVIK